MTNFSDASLDNNAAGREALANTVLDQVSYSRRCMEKLGVPDQIKLDEDYYNWRFSIKGKKFNEFRYNKTFEDIETFMPLMCSNRPSWGYKPRNPSSAAMVRVFHQYNEYLLEATQFNYYYKLAMRDMFKFKIAYMMMALGEGDEHFHWENPTAAEVFLGDYTETNIWRQPRIHWLEFYDVNEAEDLWGKEFVAQCNPGEGEVGYLEKMYDGIKELIFGFDGDQRAMKDEVIAQWKMGRLVGVATEEQQRNKVMLSHVVNGKLADRKWSVFPNYRMVCYKNYPQNRHALGISITEMNKPYSDAITSYMQNALRYFNATAKGIYLIPKGAKIGKAEFEDILKKGNTVLEVDDKYVTAGANAFKPIQQNAIPPGIFESIEFIRSLGDRQGGNINVLAGIAGSSADSGKKTDLLQQAGAGRLKLQAQFNDDDGNYKQGKNVLFYMQKLTPLNQIVAAVGENDEQGNPIFIDVNKTASREVMMEMYAKALQGEGAQPGVSFFTPEQVKQQYKIQEAKVREKAQEVGQVEIYKLNDLSAGEYSVSVANSDVLPFNEQQRRNSAVAMKELGDISSAENRELNGWDTDPASMAKIPNYVKTTPVQEYAQVLQNPELPPDKKEEVIQEMMQDLAQYQKTFGK